MQGQVDPIPSITEAQHEQHQHVARSGTVVQKKSILKNATYLASNPDRKVKMGATTKEVAEGLNVVPLEAGHEVTVVPHNVKSGSNKHNAILIVEPGYEANVGVSSKVGKGRGKGPKVIGESQRKGLRVRKQVEIKSPSNRAPTVWAKEFVDQID
ncbi:hypothetical protein V6N13_082652 [Hibiscus sabdariffa]|uniref:Uncharacterized protein n=1 Tax=Hibiscus sabdariffa TaxID=183260 RepID=A0ABR2Q420_9ROSI